VVQDAGGCAEPDPAAVPWSGSVPAAGGHTGAVRPAEDAAVPSADGAASGRAGGRVTGPVAAPLPSPSSHRCVSSFQ
ncbi:hypothetical protein ABZ960_37465, partial [Streptomyces pseudovenezuelae]|uniref:hypothetical protein n=1 Tax=Streptomyces pseudovenezuelae TaxID=67350 RepID=UPI0034A51B21